MLEAVIFGLVDAFNPCLLLTIFFLVFLVFEFAKRGINVPKHSAFFITVFFISSLLFGMGLFMHILYAKKFFEAGRIFYICAGAVLAFWGAVHLRDWWVLTRRGKEYPMRAPLTVGPYKTGASSIKISVFLSVAAFVFAALSTLWPSNHYILVSSAYLLVPGKTVEVLAILLIYNFMLVIPFLGVFVLIESDLFSRWVHRIPSMIKIVLSSLLIALGGSLMYIFRQY